MLNYFVWAGMAITTLVLIVVGAFLLRDILRGNE